MLYLPPHYAHDGVAVGECMTYSIGFRAPTFQEFGESLLQFMAETIELPGRYADPTLQPTARPAEISSDMVDRFEQEMEKIRFTREDILIHLGEFLSEPKPAVFFDTPARPTPLSRFAQLAAKHGVVLARQTRMLYRQRHVFINGDSFHVDAADRKLLSALADQRRLDASALAQISDDLLEALHNWHEDGWLRIAA
jgi:50S ribosomal protein L16 3-hydroxylase